MGTRLMSMRSNTAPIVAMMIADTMPEPKSIPDRGSIQLAIKAPALPAMRSPTGPKPVPQTTWPATQPATNMTRRASPEMSIFALMIGQKYHHKA